MENLVLEPQLQADLDAVLNRGVKSAYVREDGHLIFVMSDNQEVDLGDIQGPVMEAVKTYIEEHAVTVDDTLTVSGAAADAAAVGVRFGDMESRLERFQEKFDETDEKLENVESAAQAAADMAADAAERQEALEQALLQKIEDLGSSRVAKSGDTMTGSLDLGGNDLQNVGTAQLQVLALLPPNDPDGELGVNAYAEAAILGEDGHPTGQVLSFYGIFNDEPAVLRNVHDPVMDTDAVPKGYLEQYMNTHGGAAEVHVGGDEPDAESVLLWLDTDEEASSGSVTSVNGKTGAVELTAEDVGALPNTTVIPVVPDALPNPSKLILTGAVEAEYDGSQEVTVEIPAGGSGGSGGGTDFGITGASVGQIAKITAVDENGVPTAWEPVDMPVWAVLAEVTLEKDATPLLDMGATLPNFEKVRLSIQGVEVEASTTINVRLSNINDGNSGLSYQIGSYTTGKNGYVIEIEPVFSVDKFFLFTKSYTVGGTYSSNANYSGFDYSRLSAVRYTWFSASLPAGTRLTLEGVRK